MDKPAMEARVEQEFDITDEDIERVERETAPLLREGLIQKIASLEAIMASLRADGTKAAEELERLRQEQQQAGELLSRITIAAGRQESFNRRAQRAESELARERERHRKLREVMSEMSSILDGAIDIGFFDSNRAASLVIKSQLLLEPKAEPAPVATGEKS